MKRRTWIIGLAIVLGTGWYAFRPELFSCGRDFDVIELNEAFASQALACLRQLGLPDDAEHVNPNGGAIALGHPLGMSGTRLALTAIHHMARPAASARSPPCASASGRGYRWQSNASNAQSHKKMPQATEHSEPPLR